MLERLKAWWAGVDVKSLLKKSVTVPIKIMIVGGALIWVLAFALAMAHRAQSTVDAALGTKDIPADIEVLASIDDLKKTLASVDVCKPAPKVSGKKALK